MTQKRAVGVIGTNLADLGRIGIIHDYCTRRGYRLVAVAPDEQTARTLVGAGAADVIALGDRSWLISNAVEVVSEELYRHALGAPHTERASRPPGRRPQRLR